MMKCLVSGIVALLALVKVQAGGSYGYGQGGGQPSSVSIYDVVRGSSRFDILETALKRTGLDSALDDPSAELTVFAPTDGVSGVCKAYPEQVGAFSPWLSRSNHRHSAPFSRPSTLEDCRILTPPP